MEDRQRHGDKHSVTPDSEGLQFVGQQQIPDKFVVSPRPNSSEHPQALIPGYSGDDGVQPDHGSASYIPGPYGDTKEPAVSSRESQGRKRRYLGMPLWLLVSLIALLVVIIFGAVLGGVLGTRKNSNKDAADSANATTPSTSDNSTISGNDTTPVKQPDMLPKPLSGTTMATLKSANSENMLLYYQMANKSIVEASFPASAFNTTSIDNVNITTFNWSLVTSDADIRTPLTAVILNETLGNTVVTTTQVFYTIRGIVNFSNRTNINAAWVGSAGLFGDGKSSDARLAEGSSALCAVADSTHMHGMRLYIGVPDSPLHIQEAQMNTDGDNAYIWGWATGRFSGDSGSGIACTARVQEGVQSTMVNVYYRDRNTGFLQRSWYSYSDDNDNSKWTNATASSVKVLQNGGMAGSADTANMDYVYTSTAGGIERQDIDIGLSSMWKATHADLVAPNVTSMYSWYAPGVGPVLVVPADDGTGIQALVYDDSGVLQMNATLV
ncbi:hypothetical protein AAFC00_001901 [Neodothiora populina]|uniref:Fucose-specific lectin n=1 Tax=Neodothiora populina TaxID=2781224 RepID=A0ABR3PQH8_9PEZI